MTGPSSEFGSIGREAGRSVGRQSRCRRGPTVPHLLARCPERVGPAPPAAPARAPAKTISSSRNACWAMAGTAVTTRRAARAAEGGLRLHPPSAQGAARGSSHTPRDSDGRAHRGGRTTCHRDGPMPLRGCPPHRSRVIGPGSSPGLRVSAGSGLSVVADGGPQWHVRTTLAAYSCGGSAGFAPASLFTPHARGT